MRRNGRIEDRWLVSLCLLAAILLFVLLHPYRGLIHDARLYTLQALGHFAPDLYAGDIFLRLGSQDDFTFFSPVYAALIGWMGIEPAASVLTLAALLLFVTAVWMFARNLMPAVQAGMVLVLLFLIPAHYGSGRVFHYLEGFVTPRQLAAALTLLALVLHVRGKEMYALVTGLSAMAIHPLIALPGLVLALVFRWGLPVLTRFWPAALFGAAGLCIAAFSGLIPMDRWQFDPEWHAIVTTRGYLTLTQWSSEDWSRVLAIGATLGIGALTLEGTLRQLALAALITAAALMLGALAGSELRLVLIMQAQLWRVLWLATVMAIILMPPLFSQGWRSGSVPRCGLLLLAAAWASPHGTLTFIAAPLSLLLFGFRSYPISPSRERLLVAGSIALILIAVVHGISTSWLAWNENLATVDALPPVLQKITLLGDNGVIPALVITLAWTLVRVFQAPAVRCGLVVVGLAALAGLLVPASRAWAAVEYRQSRLDAFEAWKARIPVGAEVLWVDSRPERAAMNTWMLLQRPNYLSETQAPNALFSRPAAMEMNRRADVISRLLPYPHPFRDDRRIQRGPLPSLATICAEIDVRYIVTNLAIAGSPASIPAPPGVGLPHRNHRLHTCP